MPDELTGFVSQFFIVCCKTYATYGCYNVIRYRRRRARSLMGTNMNEIKFSSRFIG
ncbi:hypothetical protein ElyMa_005568700, partial [Elysia marginata]